MKYTFLPLIAAILSPFALHADEQLFGNTRGAETLPKGKAEVYQFITLRTGKDAGTYRGWDFDTEVEYGITDKFQASLAVNQHAFHIRGNSELADDDSYHFGGVEASIKYNLLSPFNKPVGVSLRLEGGYLITDDVGGLRQKEIYVEPSIIFQKNFFDDTLITALNLGVQLAWGKKPAEEYSYEIALEGAAGVSYRFAPNWFIGVEARVRSEYPNFDFGFHEHTVVFVGPALHYGGKKWWSTLSYGYQVWGTGVDEPVSGKTYLEEARNEFRLKVGFNF
jgi:hypothetical protein